MRFRRIAVIAILLPLTASCGSTTPSNAPSSVTPVPATAPWLVVSSTQPGPDQALGVALQAAPAPSGSVPEKVDLVRQTDGFAYIVATPTADGWAGEGDIVIAVKEANGWHVFTRSDTNAFCAALAKAPLGLISDAERAYLAECS